MRIIAGEFRHRGLQAPRGLAVRPSSDRLRETLFNILGESIRQRLFVDLYAGSGAVGLEAWSRGARPVLWVEKAAAALAALRGNLRALGLSEDGVCARSVEAMMRASAWPVAADPEGACIFLDPPYGDEAAYARVLAQLDARTGLAPAGSRVIAETRRGVTLPAQVGRLQLTRAHPAGSQQLWFYRAESL